MRGTQYDKAGKSGNEDHGSYRNSSNAVPGILFLEIY